MYYVEVEKLDFQMVFFFWGGGYGTFRCKILVFLIRILIRSAFDSLLDPYSDTDPHLGSLRNIMKCHIAPKHV